MDGTIIFFTAVAGWFKFVIYPDSEICRYVVWVLLGDTMKLFLLGPVHVTVKLRPEIIIVAEMIIATREAQTQLGDRVCGAVCYSEIQN